MSTPGSYSHHPATIASASVCIQNWLAQVSGTRCPQCWLEIRKCFCSNLIRMYSEKQSDRNSAMGADNFDLGVDIEVLLYYHYIELGRSVNTAHIMKILFPEVYREVIYGDVDGEQALFDQIQAEQNGRSRPVYTCVLYPNSEAVGMKEWLTNVLIPSQLGNNGSNSSNDSNNSNSREVINSIDNNISRNMMNNDIYSSCNSNERPLIRMILLDGTYSQAGKQYKHLCKCNEMLKLNLAFVKLDLDENGCESSLSKIVNQPEKSKICTHQAAIMAIREVREVLLSSGKDVVEKDFQAWKLHLDAWLSYILSAKIKLGQKEVIRPRGLTSIANNSNSTADLAPSSLDLAMTRRNDIFTTFKHRKELLQSGLEAIILIKTNKFASLSLITNI